MAALIAIYLQDHHAGACGGVALAKRMAASNRGTPYGEELRIIAAEIAADRAELERVMDQLGVAPSRFKDAGARAFEMIGRLKPNGHVRSYSPLSRVFELEGLIMGVTGKLKLWEALSAARSADLAGIDLDGFAERARSQRERLDGLRQKAVLDAFQAQRAGVTREPVVPSPPPQ